MSSYPHPSNSGSKVIFDDLFPTKYTVESSAKFKSIPEDFKVTEITNFDFTGIGEHLYLYIEKTNANTEWMARQLAKACGVPQKQVSFAGMKDRNAITKQWFSVQLPKIDDANMISQQLPESSRILQQSWHSKKLKRGQLDFNHFEINLRNIEGNKEGIEENIQLIKKYGVPNYFGPQRFGHNMKNIEQAEKHFLNPRKRIQRNLRSLLISSSRSLIFNSIVAYRLKNNLWDQCIEGDLMQLDGSHSWFAMESAKQKELSSRLESFDIHITAPLWGEDIFNPGTKCSAIELSCAEQFPILKSDLEKIRSNTERRAIRLIPRHLNYQWLDSKTLKLSFDLAKGSYATSLLREIVQLDEAS